MDFRARTPIPYPAAAVVATLRDDLELLVPHLGSIAAIEAVDLAAEPQTGAVHAPAGTDPSAIRRVNRWTLSTPLPKSIAGIVQADMLTFEETSWWSDGVGEWIQVPGVMPGRIDCRGRNRVVADGPDACILETEGKLTIDTGEWKGALGIIARRVGREVERLVVGSVTSTLSEIPAAVSSALALNAAA